MITHCKLCGDLATHITELEAQNAALKEQVRVGRQALIKAKKFMDYDGGCDCYMSEHCRYCSLSTAADDAIEKALAALEKES